MNSLSALLAFIVAFTHTLCKSVQQLNVVHEKLMWIPPVSMVMSLCEVAVIGLVVHQSYWLAIFIGLGSAFGCLLAIHLHKKIRGENNV